MTERFSRRRALEGLVHSGAGVALSGGWLSALLQAGQSHAAAAQDAGAAKTPVAAGKWQPRFFTAEEGAAVLSVVELIIPSSDGPGAREAQSHVFIDAVLAEGPPEVQEPFRKGLTRLRAKGKLNEALQALSDQVDAHTTGTRIDYHLDSQYGALPVLDASQLSPEDAAQLEWFVGLKSLTAMGYLTSSLFEQHLFHADYQGCGHPEHQ
ncbi:MAG: gluconate 2-dehydrogenase subunit 3 family protein [Archangiaceae bacterium]|nr:gluconate 2-dehydrogenase subunit 3 family protein [Archangiaceae bacterium]